MNALLQTARTLAAVSAFALLAGCGGGGGKGTSLQGTANVGVQSVASPAIPGANVLQVVVDSGTDGSSINTPFVTVRVCLPGTATCVDVDHVVLDTGSSGLRIAASALPADWLDAAAPSLPPVTAGGDAVGQCMTFASGYSWGSVRRADVRMGGEVAQNLPIQVINDVSSSAYTRNPNPCVSLGVGGEVGSGNGAKGILGVGFFTADCGAAARGPINCATSTDPRRNMYYRCTLAGSCAVARVPEADQVANPVAFFADHNNGVAITLPAVPSGGASLATGWMVLGVGTAANNRLGAATIFRTDVQGNFRTSYRGVQYAESFIDSGSNGLFFDDPDFPSCGDFYCPPSTPATLTATNTSIDGVSGRVDFIMDSVTAIRADAAAAHIGGSNSLFDSFDWGLPFFFGRTVFTVRNGATSPDRPAVTGPYWAY